MNGRLIVPFVIALIAVPLRTSAQDARPQPLQELFLTEVVYPQEKGEIQLTLSSLLDRSSSHGSGLVTTAIEYGLTNRWQIEASWDGYALNDNPFSHLRSVRGSVGTKYSFMNIGKSRVHSAVGFDIEFPDQGAFDESNEDEIEAEPFIALAADVSKRVTLFGTAGVSLAVQKAAPLAEIADDPGTVSVGGLVAFHRATVALEYTNRSDQLPWRLNGSPLLTPSFTVHPGHQWEFSAAMPVGTRTGARRPGLGLHLIKEF